MKYLKVSILCLFLLPACSLVTKKKKAASTQRIPASVTVEDPFVRNFLNKIENAPSRKY
ncbi:MAG: hypothetical protein OXB92_16570 [Acidimicrobiaceae bacterium]|nr:hypothetical protein [Acidimicrobiaceae bacterium]